MIGSRPAQISSTDLTHDSNNAGFFFQPETKEKDDILVISQGL